MTHDDVAILKKLAKGTRLRLITTGKGDRDFWLSETNGWKARIMKTGVYMRSTGGYLNNSLSYSPNRGFSGQVNITPDGAHGEQRGSWVRLECAKVILWKDGEPEIAIHTD
jgi:hypothetical protein